MNVLQIIKIVGGLLAVGAAIYSLTMHSASDAAKKRILFAWLLFPPIFFWLEYYFYGRTLSGDELGHFKALQGHASKIWAGLSSVLTIAFFKSKAS